MNIAYIVPSLAAKGPVLVVYELVKVMMENDHLCTVFYFDEKPPLDFPCTTVKIQANQAIDFVQFDVVHSHGMRPDKYVSRFREHSGRVKYMSTVHPFVFQDFRHQYNWFVAQVFGRLWMRSLGKLDRVITLSKTAKEYYKQWITPAKLTYAYNTRTVDYTKKISNDELATLQKFKGEATLIGVNAVLSTVKGIDILIDALAELPNHKLYIVGDGRSREELEKQARKVGVYDRCFFAGTQPEAYRYLPHYDIFAMPSRSEGFPLSLLEAACYGKACVVSDIEIFREIVTKGTEVEMFELDTENSIVGAIGDAMLNRDVLSRNIYALYLEKYSPRAFYDRHIKIYDGEI